MAAGATIHAFDIELADSDRDVYQSLQLRIARHPSETADHLLARVLAYCLEFDEGISFSNGLFSPDEPAIAVRDLTGQLRVWVDIGAPEAARLHRAAKAAPRVAVYTHKDAAQLAARLGAAHIHRAAELEIHAFDRDWLTALAAGLEKRMEFALTVSERHLYLSRGADTTSAVLERIHLAE
jgi:uncharacterized protein YaeQ